MDNSYDQLRRKHRILQDVPHSLNHIILEVFQDPQGKGGYGSDLRPLFSSSKNAELWKKLVANFDEHGLKQIFAVIRSEPQFHRPAVQVWELKKYLKRIKNHVRSLRSLLDERLLSPIKRKDKDAEPFIPQIMVADLVRKNKIQNIVKALREFEPILYTFEVIPEMHTTVPTGMGRVTTRPNSAVTPHERHVVLGNMISGIFRKWSRNNRPMYNLASDLTIAVLGNWRDRPTLLSRSIQDAARYRNNRSKMIKAGIRRK